jgi:circadian clock protein KaiB
VSSPAGVQAGEGEPAPVRLQLALFISGASPTSIRAVRRLRDLCDRHFPEGYDLEIIDIYQQPEVVVSRGVLAVPTLFKDLPLPVRVLIGDLTDEARVLAELGLSNVRGD